MHAIASWDSADDAREVDAKIAWVHTFTSQMTTLLGAQTGSYINTDGGDVTGADASRFFGENAARLAAVQAKYDPQRLLPGAPGPSPLALRAVLGRLG